MADLKQNNVDLRAGVIEGFFGKPWSWETRLSGADFLHRWGYRFYIYAPKSDSFLRRRWREPIPPQTLLHLSELGVRCRRNGVAFGIGLTPFEIYREYDADTQESLRAKVLQIDQVGVDLLCILFDDMRGDIEGLAERQARVISDICNWSSAGSFVVCPTYYSYDQRLALEFGSPPKAYLRDLAKFVDPRVDFFWTGEKINSDGYSIPHLADVAADIGRKPFIWDNYIANDAKTRTNFLFLDPAAGTWNLPADHVAGVAINPMNQPYLSRIALREFQNILTRGPGTSLLPSVCRELCGPIVAEHLIADIDLFQNKGLTQLDAGRRRHLLDQYEKLQPNPFAAEVAAWLRGEYLFDPECLTV
ncbi:MAG TPA: beta-N-acetylglucosaminidase domain-containing protein [Steroidobacteraceae bacterium]